MYVIFSQIGDYGMARFLYPNDYLRIQRFGMEEEVNDDDKLPLRWLPPEILAHLSNKKYDMKKRLKSIPRSSSIWTLGVTLWEIAMLGGTPFSSIYSNQFQSNINVEALLRDASTNGPGAITRKVISSQTTTQNRVYSKLYIENGKSYSNTVRFFYFSAMAPMQLNQWFAFALQPIQQRDQHANA